MAQPYCNRVVRAFGLVVTLFAATLLTGCANLKAQKNTPPNEIASKKFADTEQVGADYVAAERQATQTLNAALCTGPNKPNPNRKPVNILSISAGGKYAAYCAGVLCGWTEHGTRPEFDVVTGVSGGALVTVYALLGSKYDDVLRRNFTSLSNNDLFRTKPLYYLTTQQTIGSAEPLKKLLEKEIHDGVVEDLAIAHSKGQRCLIGTMNLYTRRLCVWDLTAIAASGRPDRLCLIRKIMLAACSIPGLVAPVEFDVTIDGCRYVETHCDGGAVCQAFFRLTSDHAPDGRLPVPPASNLWVMSAGKLYCDPAKGKLGFIGKVKSATSATLYAMFRGDLYRMYTVAVAAGLKFNLCAIPPDLEVKPESMNIDNKDLRLLFAVGECEGRQGGVWRYTPPGSEPGEEEWPRGSTDYRIDESVPGELIPLTPGQPIPQMLPKAPAAPAPPPKQQPSASPPPSNLSKSFNERARWTSPASILLK